MIGLDTNVLVRYVTQDDPKQSPRASRFVESLSTESPGYVGLVSIVELVWVLTGCYSASKTDLCAVLETLLRAKELVVADAEIVWKALRLFKQGKADLADCLVVLCAAEAGCDHTVTFDRDAARHCGMRLLE